MTKVVNVLGMAAGVLRAVALWAVLDVLHVQDLVVRVKAEL